MLIVASAAVAAFLNNQGTLDSSPTPTPTATAPTPTATPKPSSTPNPTATSHPTPTQTTNQPQVTPAPTSMLPGDCKINYQEVTNSYDAQTNQTRITLAVQIIPDISTRDTYYLYPASFYLKENSAAITSPNTNDKNNFIMLQELDRIDISLTFTVKGQYTSKNYELAYTNLAPDFPSSLILVFKKIINTT